MTRTSFVHISGVAALFAGVLYCGSTIIDLVQPQTAVFTRPTDYLIEALFVMALLLTLVSYAGIHALHQGRAGRFETLSFAATTAGTACFAVAALATLVAGREVLGFVFLVGVLAAFVGSICFGIALIRASVVPRWFGIVLMLGFPISVLLDAVGGGILLGLMWLSIGYALTTVGKRLIAVQPFSA